MKPRNFMEFSVFWPVCKNSLLKCDAKCGFSSLPDARFLIFHTKNEAILCKNEPLVFLTKDFLFSAVGVSGTRYSKIFQRYAVSGS